MTIYPRDLEQFNALSRAWMSGRVTLTVRISCRDRRFSDSRVVYYRYGTMLPQSALSRMGPAFRC